jgi:hypothetical protein
MELPENFVLDIPPHAMDVKKQLDEIVKQKVEKETQWNVERNTILINAVKKIMISRLEGDAVLKEYINRMQSISGTRDTMIFCLTPPPGITIPSSRTVVYVSTPTQTFIVMNGIVNTLPASDKLKSLIDKGVYDIYCALQKKMDESLAAAEPVAKRSKK